MGKPLRVSGRHYSFVLFIVRTSSDYMRGRVTWCITPVHVVYVSRALKVNRPSYPCFSRYKFRKRTLSSHPRFTFFILPSWEIKPEHAVVRVSSLDTTSLAMNAGELGDSAGGRRRIDMVNGWRVNARENMWGSGFSDEEMESDSVGDKSVGGSYLKSIRLPSRGKHCTCSRTGYT